MGYADVKSSKKNSSAQCIWMQAEVVQKKFCMSDFYCVACRFDKALVKVAEKNRRLRNKGVTSENRSDRIVFWKEKMREKPVSKRSCLHYMKGRIQFRTCTNDYRCGNCEFDQYFLDQHTVHAVIKPVDVLDIHGFKIPQGFYLHHGHAWVKIEEGSEVRVGLDDFSLRMLGPLDEVNAPLIGKVVSRGEKSIQLKRGDKEAAVLSPVSGIVTALNTELMSQGKKANKDPYTDGWVMRVHVEDLRENVKPLMIGNEAEAFFTEEIESLYQVIEEEAGPLAADGGQLGNDIYGNLPESSWGRLTKQFLDK